MSLSLDKGGPKRCLGVPNGVRLDPTARWGRPHLNHIQQH